MATEGTIRTGIIGFGLSGQVFHEPFLASNPDFRIDLVATGDPARQALASAQYPVVATPAELLERAGDLDLVVLCSPAHTHLEQGLAALEAGAAVVVDKPFAGSVAEATQLVEAAERLGRPLFVFQNRRWDGDFRTVRAVVASGVLGRVHRFESTFERFAGPARDRWQDTTTPAQGAGITFDLGSHLVDQALQLFGPAELEAAELSVLREGGASDDDAFLSLRHESGVRSHVTVSRMAGQSGPRFRVLGTEGAYSVDGLDGQEDAVKAGARPTDEGYGQTPESAWGRIGVAGSAEGLQPYPTLPGTYADFYAGVAATLREGAPSPVDPRDALAAFRILEQAHLLSR